MPGPIQFSRKPYTVTYYKDGEKQTIRRRPPKKLHDILPKDVVELTHKKNDDWPVDSEYEVKHINPRHPNVVQLENDDGQSTFVSHYDLELKDALGDRGTDSPMDDPERNRYLLWP